MRIGIDIDGVVADTFPLLVTELNSYFQAAIKLSDIYHYDIYEFYNVTPVDLEQFYRDKGKLLMERPLPVTDSAKYLKLLHKSHEISLISARFEAWREQTEHWLQRYGIPYKNLFLAGNHDKREACRQLKVELFVDDRLENAFQIKDCGIPVILMDAPYNQADLPAGIVRCRSWPEIYATIASLIGQKNDSRLGTCHIEFSPRR